jgi:hypothetical protein
MVCGLTPEFLSKSLSVCLFSILGGQSLEDTIHNRFGQNRHLFDHIGVRGFVNGKELIEE